MGKKQVKKAKTALEWFADMNDHEHPRKVKAAMKWFQSQKRPHKYLFNTPNGFYWKTTMEECAKVLVKWIDEPKVIRHFIWVASEINVPGSGYAYQELIKAGPKNLKLLKKLEKELTNPDEKEIIEPLIEAIEDDQFDSDDVVKWVPKLWSGSVPTRQRALDFISKNFNQLAKRIPNGDRRWYKIIAILDWHERGAQYHKEPEIEKLCSKLIKKIRDKDLKSTSDDPNYWVDFMLTGAEPELRIEAIKWFNRNLSKVKWKPSNSNWWHILASGHTGPQAMLLKNPPGLDTLFKKIIARLGKENSRDDWLKYAGMAHNDKLVLVSLKWLSANFDKLWSKRSKKWFELLEHVQRHKETKELKRAAVQLEKKIVEFEPNPQLKDFYAWMRYTWDWKHPYLIRMALKWLIKNSDKIPKHYGGAFKDFIPRLRELADPLYVDLLDDVHEIAKGLEYYK